MTIREMLDPEKVAKPIDVDIVHVVETSFGAEGLTVNTVTKRYHTFTLSIKLPGIDSISQGRIEQGYICPHCRRRGDVAFLVELWS
jgi:hypothetical protein